MMQPPEENRELQDDIASDYEPLIAGIEYALIQLRWLREFPMSPTARARVHKATQALEATRG